MPELLFYVYILASSRNGTLYIGHTDNLERRVAEHKTSAFPKGFTSRYAVNLLVYWETFSSREEAKLREKKLKKYARERKLNLIESGNPQWKDLAANWKS